MSNLRPFQVVVLAIFGLLALVGLVLLSGWNGGGIAKAKVGTVTIWGTLPQSQVEPALNHLKQIHKEYAGVSYTERSPETIDTDIANAIASGTGPDLVLINQEHFMAERARLRITPFSSISQRTYQDSYLPIFDLYLTSEGTYGIPLLVDPLILYYNKSVLESIGVAQAPATWETVSGLTPTLTRLTDAQTISRSAIGMGVYENITNAPALVATLLFQAGQSISTNGAQGVRATLASGGATTVGVSASESAINFYTEFANPTKSTYTWNRSLPASRQMFATGDLVLYPGFASERSIIAATNPNLGFDMAKIPQPATATTKVTYGRAYVLATPKASDNPGGAYLAALALSANDVLPILARGVGMAPGARSMLTTSTQDLYEPVFYPEALTSKGWLSPVPSTLDSIFAAMIGNVNSGRMKPKEALYTADQALNAALAQ